MSAKSLIWINVFIWGAIGGFIPMLWGAGMFDVSGIIGNTIGGIFGIWVGWKMSQIF